MEMRTDKKKVMVNINTLTNRARTCQRGSELTRPMAITKQESIHTDNC